MLKSYVLLAYRKLLREKAYVLINILSLALGLATSLILALYLRSELTYDRHHADHERIYRVTARLRQPSGTYSDVAVTQVGLGPLLTRDYPQLGQFVRLRSSSQSVLEYDGKKREWDRIYLADPSVFDVFTHKPIYGDIETAFADPYSIAVSETFAKAYFGDTNPIGKKVSSGAYSYKVTLVFEDLPENSHVRYDALYPFELMNVFLPGFDSNHEKTLWSYQLFTYLKVTPEFDANDFGGLARDFYQRYMAPRANEANTVFEGHLQPLADVHFGPRLEADLAVGNIFYVYGFAAVAVFILLVACINYVNLATARASKRAKEVGMRKVLGATQGQLIRQFLGESLLFSIAAMLVAFVAIVLALEATPIGTLMNKERLLALLVTPSFMLGTIALVLIVGIAAGLYPALYLASISPLAALTQVKRSWRAGYSLRQVLVLLQLAISIGVIACTLLMIEQMRYVEARPLGFDKDNKLVLRLRGYDLVKNVPTIEGELRRLPNVVGTTTFTQIPGAGSGLALGPVETEEGVMMPTGRAHLVVGLDFPEVMKLRVVHGRSFSQDIVTDLRESVIVNESFVKRMGWTEPLGKRFKTGPEGLLQYVIGVVEDFHYESLHNEIGPMAMVPGAGTIGNVPANQRALVLTGLVVSISGQNIRETHERILEVIEKFDRSYEIEPAFLEDRLAGQYRAETSLMKLTGVFAGICILIAVMGIFGLAAFAAEQRTKEIGIRKVLGASDAHIATMLSRPLLWIVVLAAVPASYAGYRAMELWLQRFAYRTDVSMMTFVVATFSIAVVAVTTVVLQSLRTARGNPVDALRCD